MVVWWPLRFPWVFLASAGLSTAGFSAIVLGNYWTLWLAENEGSGPSTDSQAYAAAFVLIYGLPIHFGLAALLMTKTFFTPERYGITGRGAVVGLAWGSVVATALAVHPALLLLLAPGTAIVGSKAGTTAVALE